MDTGRTTREAHLLNRLAQELVLMDCADDTARQEVESLFREVVDCYTGPGSDLWRTCAGELLEYFRTHQAGLIAEDAGVLSRGLETLRAIAEGTSTQVCEPQQESDAVEAGAVWNDPAVLKGFIAEAREHLDTAEADILEIEQARAGSEALNDVFRAFHTIKGVASMLRIEPIRDLAHAAEDLLDWLRGCGAETLGAYTGLVMESVDELRAMVCEFEAARSQGGAAPLSRDCADLQQRLREAIDRSGSNEKPAPASVRRDDPAPAAVNPESPRRASSTAGSVRIDAERLDRLLDGIGELVVAASMVTHSEEVRLCSHEFGLRNTQLDKITREVQEMGMALRMVPVRATFQKMTRLVRDLAHNCGKRVELVTSGETTEIDKSMVDLLSDPLVHMVRNSVDHGIETPAERLRAGKPECGRITITAAHRGGSIWVELTDDGRGLDRKRIIARAREQNLLSGDNEADDDELARLIFLPGFSTAAAVTETSGRGVGMDVVKRNIEQMRGAVTLRFTPGQGTRFTIRLPLTLAIIEGLIVTAARTPYIVPVSSVIQAVRVDADTIETVLEGGEMLRYRDGLLPLWRLERTVQNGNVSTGATRQVALVVEESGTTAALLVDEIIGKQQFVIKSLRGAFAQTPGIAGCSIMADGRVGLIIAVAEIVMLASSSGRAPVALAAGSAEERAVVA